MLYILEIGEEDASGWRAGSERVTPGRRGGIREHVQYRERETKTRAEETVKSSPLPLQLVYWTMAPSEGQRTEGGGRGDREEGPRDAPPTRIEVPEPTTAE
ncbi:unnamed protein product [Danaus chrysippus]|uniref:(African queen) hypothetical protein n=1 Tax=Danaus chrysippus TaxID=151541 RepID=A0A8J2RDG3_9NEOP|nr:unnamed protein product [Danaus chrysippus]